MSARQQIFASGEVPEVAEREALLSELLVRSRAVEDVKLENLQLRATLKLDAPPDWKALRAEVIMRDPVTWNWEFRIGRGSADGIRPGNAVLLEDCLIGRVSQVFNESACVLTLASPRCKLSVYAVNASGIRFSGICRGNGGLSGGAPPFCTVDYLPKEAELAPGDITLTSGLGTETPFGIPVGLLTTPADNPAANILELVDNARARAAITPIADFSNVHFVTVFINSNHHNPAPEDF